MQARRKKRTYPRRERRLNQQSAAAIVRQRYQFTAAHVELCQTLIEIDAMRRHLGAPETFEQDEPRRELTSHDAAAIASDFLTNCKLELDPRTRTLRPRRRQPHRPTETRLHDYIRWYRADLERRTTDTAPIRSIRP